MQINIPNINKTLILFFLFGLLHINSYSQDQEWPHKIVAYVNNFIRNVNWKNIEDNETFNITVISDDEVLTDVFEIIYNKNKAKGKKVKLTILDEPNKECLNSQVIFIDENKEKYYIGILEAIENKPVLLISDNYPDKRFIMFNVFDMDDNDLHYELNRENITSHNLEVSDEIIIHGGTNDDLLKLYYTSQQNLKTIQKKAAKYEAKLITLNSLILKTEKEIKEQNKKISQQNLTIKNKENFIHSQQKNLESYVDSIQSQISIINKKNEILKSQKNEINEQTEKLSWSILKLKDQKHDIEDGRKRLSTQQQQFLKMDYEIKQNIKILGEQNTKITTQRHLMTLFVVIIILGLILVIVIFRSSRANKLKNKQLSDSKIVNDKMNTDLEISNTNLLNTNNELNLKNEELQNTLKQLTDTQNQLLQSKKMASIGILTAGIAHEINNPINFVYAGSNCLINDFADVDPILKEIEKISENKDENEKIIQNILALKKENLYTDAYEAISQTILDVRVGSKRVFEIVKGLRNFSHLSKNELKKTEIHSIIDETLLLLNNELKFKIDVQKNYDTNSILVECFPNKLNQVFMNLIKNATDSIENNGIIKINTKFTKKFVTIKIADSGKGISKELQNKIFDPFFSTKDTGNGVGLGLSITYGIIKEHNGKIILNSIVNKGTEFIVTLPISQKRIKIK